VSIDFDSRRNVEQVKSRTFSDFNPEKTPLDRGGRAAISEGAVISQANKERPEYSCAKAKYEYLLERKTELDLGEKASRIIR